jgi:hypothetical protein
VDRSRSCENMSGGGNGSDHGKGVPPNGAQPSRCWADEGNRGGFVLPCTAGCLSDRREGPMTFETERWLILQRARMQIRPLPIYHRGRGSRRGVT